LNGFNSFNSSSLSIIQDYGNIHFGYRAKAPLAFKDTAVHLKETRNIRNMIRFCPIIKRVIVLSLSLYCEIRLHIARVLPAYDFAMTSFLPHERFCSMEILRKKLEIIEGLVFLGYLDAWVNFHVRIVFAASAVSGAPNME